MTTLEIGGLLLLVSAVFSMPVFAVQTRGRQPDGNLSGRLPGRSSATGFASGSSGSSLPSSAPPSSRAWPRSPSTTPVSRIGAVAVGAWGTAIYRTAAIARALRATR